MTFHDVPQKPAFRLEAQEEEDNFTMYQLNEKVAVVTGASRGIGRAIAERLAQEGMRVVAVARTQDALQSLIEGLPSPGLAVVADLRDPAASTRVVDQALRRFGCIDVLVNNAGSTSRGDFLTLTDDDWTEGYSLKFFGTMRLCREAWPHLRATHGAIVNIAGVGGKVGNADFTIGGSVNAALTHLTKSLADKGITDGVKVNLVNPGGIATERLQQRIRAVAKARQLDEAQAATELAGALKISRFGRPEEVAEVVAFLASPLSAFMQGAVVDVDGGQTRAL